MRHALTVTAVTSLYRARTRGKVADGGNLYLVDGHKWQYRYRWQGKPQTVSLGQYPGVTLAAARASRDAAVAKLAAGVDPRGKATTEADTFAGVAKRWLATQTTVAPATVTRHQRTITLAARVFGGTTIADITVAQVRGILDTMHAAGQHGALSKARVTLGAIWRYAATFGLVRIDPVYLLRGAYTLKPVKHFPHIEGARAIGELMCRLHAYQSHAGGGVALMLQLLTMVRPGEACGARWAEIDLTESMWRIPPERMKKRQPHIVPLPTQAVALLQKQKALTGRGAMVFPGQRRDDQAITTAATEGALRAMGYSREELTPHGLRATASTHLNGLGANRDDIELCLAHVEGNASRASYNHATRLPERRALLQSWADMLDAMAT